MKEGKVVLWVLVTIVVSQGALFLADVWSPWWYMCLAVHLSVFTATLFLTDEI